jgi:hypothetical protein
MKLTDRQESVIGDLARGLVVSAPKRDVCPKCGSTDVEVAEEVVGWPELRLGPD